jgi:hypothetical protein
VNIQGTLREHSGNIQGTFRELVALVELHITVANGVFHLLLKEHSGNI